MLLCALALSFKPAYAEVAAWAMSEPNLATNISITGTITRADVAKVAAAVRGSVAKTNLPFDINVWLDSDGGDVDAAMQIGRLIRTKIARVDTSHFVVMKGQYDRKPLYGEYAVCASSCVLILASGSERVCGHPATRVGIHRPYSVSPITPGQDTRAEYAALTARVKAYLEEMGLPSALYETMMKVAPEEVQWLSFRDCYALGLSATDTAYNDLKDSRDAAARSISKQEFLRRKSMTIEVCEPILQHLTISSNDTTMIKFSECIQRILNTGSP